MMGILVPILYFVHKYPQHTKTIDLSVTSVVMFTFLSLGASFFVIRVSKSVKQQLFIGLTMTNTLLKMAASVLILVIYKLQNDDVKPYFVIPFLIIYLFFTIFETAVMLRLANKKPS